MTIRLVTALFLVGCGPKQVNTVPQTNTLVPSAGVHLRNSFDTDPSSYLGRFVPDADDNIDEGSAMQMACSQHISWRFVDGGGVRYNEILSVSTEVGARLGVPVVASGSGSGSANNVVRVSYTLTGKMVANIDDPDAFADCCRAQPDQCARRYIGEFIQGTGSVYHEAARAVGAQGEGLDPSSGTSGGVEFSHGTNWQRAVEFDNPVYFAFKVTQTPFSQQAVSAPVAEAVAAPVTEVIAAPTATCDGWMDTLPTKPGGTYYLGVSRDARSEQGARTRALSNARFQAAGSGQYVLPDGVDAATAASLLPGAAAEDWCVETVAGDKGDRYVARVLAWQADPTPAQLAALAAAAQPATQPATTAAQPVVVVVNTHGVPPANGSGLAPASTTGRLPSTMAGAMPDASHRQLLVAIDAASFSDDKLSLIRAAAASNNFTISQTAAILEKLSFSSDQLEALALLRPRIVDPQNAAQLGSVFSFSSDLESAMELFE
jgi:hypothetical protein